MPITSGVDELSLRKLPIELEDLEQVKASLPQLRILHLSEAQKLPPDAVSILLAPHARGGVLHSAPLDADTALTAFTCPSFEIGPRHTCWERSYAGPVYPIQ